MGNIEAGRAALAEALGLFERLGLVQEVDRTRGLLG
jgi:hypothetical protein